MISNTAGPVHRADTNIGSEESHFATVDIPQHVAHSAATAGTCSACRGGRPGWPRRLPAADFVHGPVSTACWPVSKAMNRGSRPPVGRPSRATRSKRAITPRSDSVRCRRRLGMLSRLSPRHGSTISVSRHQSCVTDRIKPATQTSRHHQLIQLASPTCGYDDEQRGDGLLSDWR